MFLHVIIISAQNVIKLLAASGQLCDFDAVVNLIIGSVLKGISSPN